MTYSRHTAGENRVKLKILAIIAITILAGSSSFACHPSPPIIRIFVATPSETTSGEPAVLRWQVEGATTVSIDQGIGAVPPAGTVTVSPQRTLAYTLTASNKGGMVTRSVVIYVSPAVTAPTVDTTPPVISDITTSPQNESTVIVSWTTNEPTTGRLEYGNGTEYSHAASSKELKTAHSAVLDGLDANTVYHFRIVATDEAGNEATSTDNVFTTPAPKSTFSLQLNSLEWGRKREFEGEGYGEDVGRRLIYLTGTAQNTTNATLRTVICTMHCWSGNRLVKSEVYVYQAPILPGYVFKFNIQTPDDPSVDNVTIEFADHLGRQIKVTQK